MSRLSGFDSDVVGFDSALQFKRPETSTSTQTTEFAESSVETQTNSSLESASMTDDMVAPNAEYSPTNLNAFLKKVVPGILDQLNRDEHECSSDSDEDEVMIAKVLQSIQVEKDVNLGSGDHQTWILGMSWSNIGNSLAVSIGQAYHEGWCEHQGLIRIYTTKTSAGDKLVHSIDVSEKNCITVLKYHPSVALLAYGTTAGEVVICNLRETGQFDMQLTSPSGCHGSRTVTALQWVDAALANHFLTIQISNTGKRRSATDQVLISAGVDGTVNAWQVNANLKVFENIVCFGINKSKDLPEPDISCLDFMKSCTLKREQDKKDGLFVVGSKTGNLFLCQAKNGESVASTAVIDPVCEVMESHNACVLDVTFSTQRPAIFASVAVDSEFRIYDVNQATPIKVMSLHSNVSSATWLSGTCLFLTGEDDGKQLRVWRGGRELPVSGLEFVGTVTALAGSRSGNHRRIAAGDAHGLVRVWELSTSRHIRTTAEEFLF